nr:hypothetical protein [Tanacetum cinerariifolium]
QRPRVSSGRHALWGVSHWGRKRKQFYGYAVNQESARDVYSKRRIIAVTELQIVEWHDYKHFDWISEHCHQEASGRPLTGSGKLPEEAQPYEARYGKVSSIPTVFSWIDSISADGFLSFILLVVVIMVTGIIVAVVLEIVVVVIVGVVIVVTGGCVYAFHQDKASLVRVTVANVTMSSLAHLLRENTNSFPLFTTGVSFDLRFLLGLSVFSMVAASASRAAAIPSEIN